MSAPTLDDLAQWLEALGDVGAPESRDGDAHRIDLIGALRRLENAAVAAQARLAHRFEESQRAEQAASGIPRKQVGRGIPQQVAGARRESPRKARQFLGLARIVATEMPHTARVMADGDLDEWTVTQIVRETATLPLEVRTAVDTDLVGSGKATRMSRKAIVDQTRAMAAKLDNAGVAERRRIAEKDRRVTIRPAPDAMVHVTAVMPVAEGVGVYAALQRAAHDARAAGDERTQGQVMTDTLHELVTGRHTDVPPPVHLDLMMTEKTLLGGDTRPAHLAGYGVVPAEWARDLVARAVTRAAVWVKRLYVAPGTGELMAMDVKRRKAPTGLEEFVRDRDRWCRTPWCGAPVRTTAVLETDELDRGTPAAGAIGLCVPCSRAQGALGWAVKPRPGPTSAVEFITPTRHSYVSYAPPPWGGDDDAA